MDKTYKLFTDGGSRGNPGKAACAAVLYDLNDNLVESDSKYLGINTNNFGEYEGLILGLNLARKLDCTKIKIFMDSELVVNQLLGKYRVKDNTLKEKFVIVKKLLEEFSEYSVEHVTRDKNKYADKLVNITLDNN